MWTAEINFAQIECAFSKLTLCCIAESAVYFAEISSGKFSMLHMHRIASSLFGCFSAEKFQSTQLQ